MSARTDAEFVERLHAALDRASDLAIQLAGLVNDVEDASREVAKAIVDLGDRAAENSAAEKARLGAADHHTT